MTPSAYLERRVKRLEQKHREHFPMLAADARRLRAVENTALCQARIDLAVWVEAKVRPSTTDIVWRTKRRGGPIRLDFSA